MCMWHGSMLHAAWAGLRLRLSFPVRMSHEWVVRRKSEPRNLELSEMSEVRLFCGAEVPFKLQAFKFNFDESGGRFLSI